MYVVFVVFVLLFLFLVFFLAIIGILLSTSSFILILFFSIYTVRIVISRFACRSFGCTVRGADILFVIVTLVVMDWATLAIIFVLLPGTRRSLVFVV
jgi:hypothetical protein